MELTTPPSSTDAPSATDSGISSAPSVTDFLEQNHSEIRNASRPSNSSASQSSSFHDAATQYFFTSSLMAEQNRYARENMRESWNLNEESARRAREWNSEDNIVARRIRAGLNPVGDNMSQSSAQGSTGTPGGPTANFHLPTTSPQVALADSTIALNESQAELNAAKASEIRGDTPNAISARELNEALRDLNQSTAALTDLKQVSQDLSNAILNFDKQLKNLEYVAATSSVGIRTPEGNTFNTPRYLIPVLLDGITLETAMIDRLIGDTNLTTHRKELAAWDERFDLFVRKARADLSLTEADAYVKTQTRDAVVRGIKAANSLGVRRDTYLQALYDTDIPLLQEISRIYHGPTSDVLSTSNAAIHWPYVRRYSSYAREHTR